MGHRSCTALAAGQPSLESSTHPSLRSVSFRVCIISIFRICHADWPHQLFFLIDNAEQPPAIAALGCNKVFLHNIDGVKHQLLLRLIFVEPPTAAARCLSLAHPGNKVSVSEPKINDVLGNFAWREEDLFDGKLVALTIGLHFQIEGLGRAARLDHVVLDVTVASTHLEPNPFTLHRIRLRRNSWRTPGLKVSRVCRWCP